MTPEERAKDVMNRWTDIPGHPKNRSLTCLEHMYAAAFKGLAEEVKECCARMVEEYVGEFTPEEIARRIREG